MPTIADLKAPYPWAGGKSKVAQAVWDRLGNVDNFIEPFMGSLAVMLKRPPEHFRGGYRVETANDLNHYLVNFWRAVTADPEAVAGYADWPVTEADLHARHRWLVRSAEADQFREKMRTDPTHYDARVAGWWVWGQCCWIGSGWCNDTFAERNAMPQLDGRAGIPNAGPAVGDPVAQVPHLSNGGQGVNGTDGSRKMPELGHAVGRGDTAAHQSQQIPELGHPGGRGDTAAAGVEQRPFLSNGHSAGMPGVLGRPNLADAYDIGRGVNGGANRLSERVPMLSSADGVNSVGAAGTCDARRAWLVNWLRQLADRLRLVRTCYGHWSRVCDSDSTLTRLGLTGVFLDPPYPANRGDTGKKSRCANLYATDVGADLDALRDEVLAWCVRWGADPQIRVAVCGYEGDGYEALVTDHGWEEQAWEANGGYANQRRKGKGKAENAKRERVWYSPHCLHPGLGLFDGLSD
jgi:hypothetical protein